MAIQLFLLLIVIAVVTAMSRYQQRLDRERIREHLTNHGGVVFDIHFTSRRSARIYNVTYATKSGRVLTASCATISFRGVSWIGAAPPGLSDNAAYAAAVASASAEERRYPNLSTPEEIPCLQCGASIPASKTKCPHCGWSYQ